MIFFPHFPLAFLLRKTILNQTLNQNILLSRSPTTVIIHCLPSFVPCSRSYPIQLINPFVICPFPIFSTPVLIAQPMIIGFLQIAPQAFNTYLLSLSLIYQILSRIPWNSFDNIIAYKNTSYIVYCRNSLPMKTKPGLKIFNPFHSRNFQRISFDIDIFDFDHFLPQIHSFILSLGCQEFNFPDPT
jgi:hypothetical protein